ncbi:hypothetical protein A1Q1_03189 [Trichosporon asahii var. asahii CBS 2479]|uniref:NmrA-like domain-containing protein n=1 Tax=Trichosporon asahii var. asahii (strain ATCC 90039 / CBS 2479 / JCM 2466 / KCTC 7840 / NBRC 103889/ NCYC 2677 / UAMH 7654) TaxID=1186058 RepID=J6ETR1_TRIAS|nr:hypothetical protein A1Q1_03189 [Trichosporon asahii var. asahii CBS 2479]EJT47954.1 hypothetical protein A1Q1_03189 [Trichosporon asahii var. asahii CBS 2479]
MAAPKKVVVFGVTGNQGASVARALLEHKDKWEVWGVTRNPDSGSSKRKLSKLIKGDLDNPQSYAKGLEGAYASFVNANFWIAYKGNNSDEAAEIEFTQSSSAVEASAKAGVKHVVYSTLESYKPRQDLPHFDAKARVTEYMKKNNIPGTQLYTSFFFQNLGMAKWDEGKDGKRILHLELPDDAQMPGFSVDDVGYWVRAALEDPQKWIGKDMEACTEVVSPKRICEVLTQLSGKQWDTQHWSRDAFMEHKNKMDGELWLNYLAFANGEMKRDVEASRKIAPQAKDFTQWLKDSPKVQEHFGF